MHRDSIDIGIAVGIDINTSYHLNDLRISYLIHK